MRRLSSSVASAVIGLVCVAGATAAAQTTSPTPLGRVVKTGSGTIHGVVLDLRGIPLVGATVSALGTTSVFASTDNEGRFALRALPAGPYVVRVHYVGFAPSARQIVDVKASARSIVSITMRRATATGTAGVSSQPLLATSMLPLPEASEDGASSAESEDDDHSETAWRLRHLKRSILKQATEQALLTGEEDSPNRTVELAGSGSSGPAASGLASSLFGALPLSGQVRFLTTSSFDTPSDLFSPAGFSRNVAFVAIGAPVGHHGDWLVKGAMTQGDLSSWFVAGAYTSRRPATHRYSAGMSYSTQRYAGGNPVALAAVADGGRNAGTIYGSDEWTMRPSVLLSYGARIARYDYLTGRGLLSPRAALEWSATEHFRVRGVVARTKLAPGAEEFLPPLMSGPWVPPERTFSSLARSDPFKAESTEQYEVAVERDHTAAYVVSFRTFYQQVDDQLSALFGIELPGQPAAKLGHYYVGNVGDAAVHGWGVGFTRPLANGLRGSIDYTVTNAHWAALDRGGVVTLLAPVIVRPEAEQFHDLTTSVEKEIPQTATRVFVLCKLNSGFAKQENPPAKPGLDTRFDVQVNQSLPFLNFSSAEWEVLLAVRNMFRETMTDSSVFDELLVVRPPKRIVGGVLVRF